MQNQQTKEKYSFNSKQGIANPFKKVRAAQDDTVIKTKVSKSIPKTTRKFLPLL